MGSDMKFEAGTPVYFLYTNEIEKGVVNSRYPHDRNYLVYSEGQTYMLPENHVYESVSDLIDYLKKDYYRRAEEDYKTKEAEEKQKEPVDQSVLDRLNDHYYKIENLEHDVEAIRQYRRLDILDAKRTSLTELNIKNCSDLLGKLSTDVGYLQGSNRLLQADIKKLKEKVFAND